MKEILDYIFLGNKVIDYAVFALIIIVGISFVAIVKRYIINKLQEKLSHDISSNKKINSIKNGFFYLLYYGVIYVALQRLHLNENTNKALKILGLFLATLLIVRLITNIINILITRYCFKDQGNLANDKSIKSISPIIKVVVWGLALFFLLDNLGFKVSTLIAGLGIGGVAVALAAQAILGDLFSYFAILFDKPFEIDDFITTGDISGVIEHIGIKTTRIRSLGGEEIVFANTDLINSRIKNFKRMQQRRIVFKIGVTYQTSVERLKEIPQIIRQIIESLEHTKFDRSHFGSFGDFNLGIETVYYVLSKDYAVYMDIQQKINLRIMEEFQKLGIEFAYPTSTIILENKTNI